MQSEIYDRIRIVENNFPYVSHKSKYRIGFTVEARRGMGIIKLLWNL